MARYIDADKVIKFIKEANDMYPFLIDENEKCRVCDLIESQPDADVVPRSEVARWKKINEQLHKEMSERNLEERKIERKLVARVIFAEIQKMVNRYWLDNDYGMPDMETELSKLKKKYTEDQA